MAGKTDYKNKWQGNNYGSPTIVAPNGKKDKIKEFAQIKGKSLNGL